jgi:hypothetical protein
MWVGAAGYADDLILLSPSRTAMQHMLKICVRYAADFNLQFQLIQLLISPSQSVCICVDI